jgi:hypothetical protein
MAGAPLLLLLFVRLLISLSKSCTQPGLAVKNPPKKTHPKKTQKNHLKKTTKNVFFWVFFGFF